MPSLANAQNPRFCHRISEVLAIYDRFAKRRTNKRIRAASNFKLFGRVPVELQRVRTLFGKVWRSDEKELDEVELIVKSLPV